MDTYCHLMFRHVQESTNDWLSNTFSKLNRLVTCAYEVDLTWEPSHERWSTFVDVGGTENYRHQNTTATNPLYIFSKINLKLNIYKVDHATYIQWHSVMPHLLEKNECCVINPPADGNCLYSAFLVYSNVPESKLLENVWALIKELNEYYLATHLNVEFTLAYWMEISFSDIKEKTRTETRNHKNKELNT